MKKVMIGGGLSICLLMGVILYNYRAIEQEGDLTKKFLYVSESQSGYPMRNFGVSITNGKIMDNTKILEFVMENESARKWYWKRNLRFNEKSREYITDLEVKIDEIWYNVPFKEESANISIPLVQLYLLPKSTTTISVNTDLYQMLVSGRYRLTVIIYDENSNEFKLSSEFLITEEE